MSTTLTRTGFVLPAGPETASIAVLNSNFQLIDAQIGYTICTSTTRPSTPITGQPIYETNTGFRRYWDGSAWQLFPGQVLGGNRYSTTGSLGTSTTTESAAAMTTGALGLLNGALYSLCAQVEWQSTIAADAATIRIKDGSTVLATKSTQAIRAANVSEIEYIEVPYVAGATGNKTFTVTIQRLAGTGTVSLRGNSAGNPFILAKYVGPSAMLGSV